jgi:hypothetical protein
MSEKGGIAVAGEIYATYIHPEQPHWLSVTIEAGSQADNSLRPDRVTIRAQWYGQREGAVSDGTSSQLAEEPPTYVKHRSPRGKSKAITSYQHILRESGPLCFLNATYTSAITALCLLSVMEATRPIHYWEWLEDGALMSQEQAEEAKRRLPEARLRAKSEKDQWRPLTRSEGDPSFKLQDSYLAPVSSRLLFVDRAGPGANGRGLESPRLSQPGETVFLQRDFERDARRFLRTLGGCLAPYGFHEMRVVESDYKMMLAGEYRSAPKREMLCVQIGAVNNTDIPLRHDHLIIAVSLSVENVGEKAQAGKRHLLGVPINLTASAWARQLAAALDLQESAQDGSTQDEGAPQPQP